MLHNTLFISMFMIFAGAAFLGTFALFTRQTLLIAYIASGIILGPGVIGAVNNTDMIMDISHFGIVFLLFLLGLDLQPQSLFYRIKQTTSVTLISSFLFFGIGFFIGMFTGFPIQDSIIIGVCMMFSSTIVGLKLLPVSILHHQKMGEIVVSVLLLQDILAILVLLMIEALGANLEWVANGFDYKQLIITVLGLPVLIVLSFWLEKIIINPLFKHFESVHEYVFLLALAWCLGIGFLSHVLGLSYEIGAFLAGVNIAASPISEFIAVRLKPLRDFFLILFFFALGAGLNLRSTQEVLGVALGLFVLMAVLKPLIFRLLLAKQLQDRLAWQVGIRIGQLSEFSILVAYSAQQKQLIALQTSYLIQLTAILSFIASSIIVGTNYSVPGLKDRTPTNS